MKKTKLLLAACALFLSASMQAQKDVTAQYITNATLSSLGGWTVSNFNTPVSGNGTVNIGGNKESYNTTGYATECYAGWSSLEKTSYHLKQTITLPKGNYTLVNYSFYREGEGYNTDPNTSRAFLFAGSNSVPIKTLGSITAAGYANGQLEGAVAFDSKMYRNTVDFTIAADNTQIEIGLTGTFEVMRSWCIAGMFELINNDTPATMDSPFDVTGYITNPGFEYRDMTGWTLSENGAFGIQNNDQSFKTGLYYAEKWQASGALTARSMSQTLTNLPAGYYKLTVNMGGDGTYVDLNGKTANWTTDKDYTVGYVLGENEDLTITAGKTAEGSANWIHFDNFKLHFCGDVAAALTTLLDQVSEYEDAIPNAVYTQLQNDVAPYNQQYTDVDELLAAIAAIQALYEAADAFKAPYSEWLAWKEKAEILAAVNSDNDDANSALINAISGIEVDVEDATSIDGINACIASLKEAMTTYVFAANPVGEGAQFDCTFLMTNPDLTGFAAWTKVDNVPGWYTDQNIDQQNAQVMVNNDVACSKGASFFEYWSPSAAANGEFALYNMVNLPEGTFTINCYALATANGVQGATNSAIYFYANDTQGSCISADVLSEASISFVNETTQDVKIGLKTLEGNQFRWMGIGYVELYKVPSTTIAMSETEGYTPENVAGTVNLTKTIYSGWNTIVLPFGVNADDVQSQFGAGQLYKYIGDDEDVQLNFDEASAIEPHVPYLFKAEQAKESGMTFSGVTISTGTPKTAGTLYDFVGTYTPLASGNTVITNRDYVLGESAFKKAAGGNVLKAFRAFIKAQEAAAGAPSLKIFIDGMATSIDAIDGQSLSNSAIYNLNGQKVEKAQKGIYIQDGKKFVVK